MINCYNFKIKLIVILVLSFNIIYSNDSLKLSSVKKNTIYIELLGNAGSFSFNYDRLFLRLNKGKINLSSRIGWGFQNIQRDSLASHRIPIELNSFFGAKNSHFELGLGYTPFIYKSLKGKIVPNELKNYYLIVLRSGFRYQVFENTGGKKILPFGRVALEGFIYKDYKTKEWQIRPFISFCIGLTFGVNFSNEFYYD